MAVQEAAGPHVASQLGPEQVTFEQLEVPLQVTVAELVAAMLRPWQALAPSQAMTHVSQLIDVPPPHCDRPHVIVQTPSRHAPPAATQPDPHGPVQMPMFAFADVHVVSAGQPLPLEPRQPRMQRPVTLSQTMPLSTAPHSASSRHFETQLQVLGSQSRLRQ
jgi:hypothetical protein